MLVEVTIRHEFIDKEKHDVLSMQAPKHKVTYAAAAFKSHHVTMTRSADGTQLSKEVLKFSPGVLEDSLHSHLLILETPTVYHAKSTRSDLLRFRESVRCDRQVAVFESPKPTSLSKGVACAFPPIP
jgi:hypothetical protein